MTISLPDGSPFTVGACDYLAVGSLSDVTMARLFIPIRLNGPGVELNVMIDTGGYYLILHPNFAQELDLHVEDGLLQKLFSSEVST